MDIHLQDLNDQFAIPNHVNFQTGPGGLATAVIHNAYAKVEMTLAGGHVLTCTPHGEKPLLWISPNASYSLGKAIRGGIPVCWPWFGPHPTDRQKFAGPRAGTYHAVVGERHPRAARRLD